MQNKQSVTWFDVKTIISLVSSAVMVASSFFMLQTRLALIEQQTAQISKQQGEMLDFFKNTEQRYGELALDVKELQTLNNIRKP